MSARLMDGKMLAEKLLEEQKATCDALREQEIIPKLSVILVGEDPASQIYVRNKEKACEKIGIVGETLRLPADISQRELEETIDRLNDDPAVTGILVQLPLPKGLDEASALRRVKAIKDVDGFHVENAGLLFKGMPGGAVACTPRGILYMLKQYGVELSGKEAVVVGRSNIVGKPVAMLLLNENCTVTICHSRTKNLKEHTLRADILVAAVGKAHFITRDMVKEGAAVVDVGMNRLENGKVVGDVDFEGVSEIAGLLSPVPGGVGRLTVSMLMENTLEAAKCQAKS